MIYLLLLFLVVFLFYIYQFHGKEIRCPAFLFCCSFVFSSLFASIYADIWELDLHLNTFLVILGGVFIFSTMTLFVHTIYLKTRPSKVSTDFQFQRIQIENWKYILLILLNIICIGATYFLLIRNYGANIFVAIATYRTTSIFTTEDVFKLPRWLSYSRAFVAASGYFLSYVLANNLFAQEKKICIPNILAISSMVLSAISTCIFGGRQYAINLILALLVNILLFRRRKMGSGKSISFSSLIAIVSICMVALYFFKNAANLVGKDLSSYTTMDYLAKYCGAEIKNLDLFLQSFNKSNGSEIWGYQTFRGVYEFLGYDLPVRDLPFNTVNGFELGNVYTTFYDFIYDFGYFGMVVLTAVMGFILGVIFEKVIRVEKSTESLILCAVWSFQIPNILLAFFSDEFYSYTFRGTFLRYFVCWIIFEFLMLHVHVGLNGKITIRKKVVGTDVTNF